MRSGVLIGAAIAVLSVRLLAGGGEGALPEPSAARAAGAAAALLAGAAASAPLAAAGPAVPAAGAGIGSVAAASAPVPAGSAHAALAMRAAAVEAEVQARRARGEGEDAVYRARAAQLPPDDVAQLMAREAAESAWQRQLEECAQSCNAAAPDHVVAAAYQRAGSPRLTRE